MNFIIVLIFNVKMVMGMVNVLKIIIFIFINVNKFVSRVIVEVNVVMVVMFFNISLINCDMYLFVVN